MTRDKSLKDLKVSDGRSVARLRSGTRKGGLGLEFRGGGAWVTPEETDLAMRLRSTVQ